MSEGSCGRVLVTGLGAVSCLGADHAALWEGLCEGRCGLRPIDRFDVEGSPYVQAGQVEGFVPRPCAEAGASMGAQFAARAAREALGDDFPEASLRSLAVCLSTNFGPSEVLDLWRADAELPLAASWHRGPLQWDADFVAESVGAGGERRNGSVSCSSGNAALAGARALIRSGRADAVLAGGYDSIQKTVWAGLGALRVMARAPDDETPRVRPFDRRRNGTIFSEGAGVLLIESEEHATRRGVRILAELAGAAANNNAYHMTHAQDDGLATAEAMAAALHDAGLSPGDVVHVNAHGTGTPLNDAIETRALRTVFGDALPGVSVTSNKGGLGHGMGAASALEAIVCVRTLCEGRAPGIIHCEEPDPECDLDLVIGEARAVRDGAVLNNSAGIGGANASVVFRKATGS